jgi:hypothetical protein
MSTDPFRLKLQLTKVVFVIVRVQFGLSEGIRSCRVLQQEEVAR